MRRFENDLFNLAFADVRRGVYPRSIVKVHLAWSRSGPVVKRPAACGSCGQPFACELSLSGCWCSKVALTDAARAEIRASYSGCLCRTCLKHYERHPPDTA